MRTVTSLTAVALITAAFAAAGSAQQGPPKPAAEMAQLAYFEGMWACEGKMFQTPMSPAGTMQSTADIRKDLNGHFQTGLIKGTAANMPPFEGRFHVTYDTGMKQYVMLWVDNMGGWSQSMSSGWKDDVLTYAGEGHMGGQTMKSRDTFTKSGATSMTHAWEMQVDGKWMPAGEETCTKKK
jgi:hypothetical protein